MRRPKLPTPAMAVACTALAVSLGGTGYAATRIPEKSVGRLQLRNGAVGSQQLRDDAVTGRKIARGSVGTSELVDGGVAARDLAKGVVPAPKPDATSTVRTASGDPVAAGEVGAVSASCAAGERATGGGGGFAGPPTTKDALTEAIPVGSEVPPLRFRVSLFNGGVAPRTPVAYVYCAKG